MEINVTISAAQRRLVEALKRLAPAVTSKLAEELGVTTAAIRPQLAELETRGYVTQTLLPAEGRGRPSSAWSLTQDGISLFPDRHDNLTVELILSMREALGEKGFNKVLAKRDEHLLTELNNAIPVNASFQQRLRAIAKVRSKHGYMAEIDRHEKSFLLTENHCPICTAAQTCQQLCRNELALFQTFMDGLATVKREQHLLSGGQRCVYRIDPVT